MKEEQEPAVADPERLESMALRAGLRSAAVTTLRVDTGITDPGQLVAWRLGSAGCASFVAAMEPEARRRLRADAVAALGPSPQALVLDLRVLSSRAAPNRRSSSA